MLKTALRWLSPRGRVGRGVFIFAAVILVVLGDVLVEGVDATFGKPAGTVVVAVLVWIAICLAARRLHDTGRSAWWLVAFAIPVIGALWLAWVCVFVRGTEGENPYGADPRQRAADYLTVA